MRGGRSLTIELPDSDTRDRVLSLLEQAKPEDQEANLEAAIKDPPTLFDDF